MINTRPISGTHDLENEDCALKSLDPEVGYTRVKIRGESPYGLIGRLRAEEIINTVGCVNLDTRVVLDFDPRVPLEPERIVNINDTIHFLAQRVDDVIKEYIIRGPKLCNWIAKTGKGKSTKFPILLHDYSAGGRVLVIEPTMVLAKNAFRYVNQTSKNRAMYWDVARHKNDCGGVVFAPAATIVSAIVNDKSCLEGFDYIMLDEAHEPTGIYYALRVYLYGLKGTPNIIFVSATLDGEDDQGSASSHSTAMTKLRQVTCNDLTAAKAEDPWHFRSIRGRCLLLLDTEERCSDISAWYTRNGVTSMVYSSNTTSEEYLQICEQLTKDEGRNVVLTSTSICRTGVTLPIDAVFDMRVVVVYNYNLGLRSLTKAVRSCTLSEAKQGVGRVGRMKDGRAYVVLCEFTEFPFNIDTTQKIYACLWLIVMGYIPSKDVFPNEMKFLGNLGRLGAAQLLNCHLHPIQSRFYIDDDGLYYKNFDLAIRYYFAPICKPRFSEKVLDVTKVGWFKYVASVTCVDDGNTTEFYVPNEPSGINSSELLDCAIREMTWRSTRGPFDYKTEKKPRINPKEYASEGVGSVESPVVELNSGTALKRRSVLPSKKNIPIIDSPFSIGVVEEKPMKPVFNDAQLYKMSVDNSKMPVAAKNYIRVDSSDVGDYKSMSAMFKTIGQLSFVQPLCPFDSGRDFLVCKPNDERLVNSLIRQDVALYDLVATERRKYHDAFCAMWNKARAREQFHLDVQNVTRRNILGIMRRGREDDALNSAIAVELLQTLDAQFRLFGMFVREADRHLVNQSGFCDVHEITTPEFLFGVVVNHRRRGYAVILESFVISLEHVTANVECCFVAQGDYEGMYLYSVGMFSIYRISGFTSGWKHRLYVPGEEVSLITADGGTCFVQGPFTSDCYDERQFLYNAITFDGCSGAPLVGVDGFVVGIHVGSVRSGVAVGLTLLGLYDTGFLL